MFTILLLLFVALAMIIHELGHFFMARKCSVTCSEISFGLGPILLSLKLGEVRFSLRAFPVGSFVRLSGLAERTTQQQLLVHLGGIILNLVVGMIFFGTVFGWINLLVAGGNLLPIYQHDGWKCGVVLVRARLRRKSAPIERAFTYSGGFLSLVIAVAIVRMFI